ncbi:MAG: hypothetical protein DME57_08950 [Verrucomicrobia bacterium]|nr:MAG: hypothetical protein DME57_08950 [Verrucomicrobiota bacterium]
MKIPMTIFAAVICAAFLSAQTASAFPGQRMPWRAAHLAGKVAAKIDNHVVHPVTHGIKRRLR